MSKIQSCYDCIFCRSEPNEFEIWCNETQKIIDDGFGVKGNDIICIKFICKRNTFAFNYNDLSEPPPF